MKRDGSLTSLWQAGIDDFEGNSNVLENKNFDVVIVGGGITGVVTALLLQKAGHSCILAEAQTLCFGTTGGTTAHLNTFMDTPYDTIISDFGEENAQLLHSAARTALDLIKQNVTTYNIPGYSEKEGFVYAQDEKQLHDLEKMYKASLRAGAEVEYSENIPVAIPFVKAIKYKRQGQLHPAEYVMALAKEFEKLGGVILQHCRVLNVEGGDLLKIETNRGHLHGRFLIYATHTPPGINLLHFRLAPYRSYAMAVSLKEGIYPDGLAYDMYDPYHYYRTHEINGKQYLVVGGEDHKTAHQKNTEACFRQLEAHLNKYYDVKEIEYKWSSQYFEPADGIAYIGHLPGNPENVFVATGYGGNGITYSHIAALTLSELVLTGDSPYAKLFSPSRVKPVAGFAAFVKENADVVAQFVGKRLHAGKIKELAEIAPDEGRIVKYEGETLGVYKDHSGTVYAVNPVCTHAKCVVDWNSAERTWDCPCHGARYDIYGEVLTGPSSHSLEIVNLEDRFDEPNRDENR